MARRQITTIMDRYELTFITFFRDNEELAPIHHDPSFSSKKRFARAIAKLHEEGKVRIYQKKGNKQVYYYDILRGK